MVQSGRGEKDAKYETVARDTARSIYYTGMCLKKKMDELLIPFSLSAVQFSLLRILIDSCEEGEGLSQVEISQKMLVKAANTTTLVHRMEKENLIERIPDPLDGRAKIVRITKYGRDLIDKIMPIYVAEVERIFPIGVEEQKHLISVLEGIRERL